MSALLRSDGGKPWRDEELMRELYLEEEMSSGEIADRLDCARSTILNWLHRHDIPVRSILEAKSIKHGKHAKYTVDNRGYPIWWCDGSTKKSGMQVHRLLAVAEYGYDVVAGADVHHKNGVRWDNRPENIEVIPTRGEHSSKHRPAMSKMDVIRAAEMYREGASTYDLADVFDCAAGTVAENLREYFPELIRDPSEAGKLAWERSEVCN